MFTCTSLAGTGKQGIIQPDADGYYNKVPIGALNVFNSVGQFYVYEEARQLFEESSAMMRRVRRGVLKGELGHPMREYGMDDRAFMNRVLTIAEGNVACHFRNIELSFDEVFDSSGRPVIAILADVGPSGPHGDHFDRSMKNKYENVCFSIRSFADDYLVGGRRNRVLKQIVTWDVVTEPGIATSEKYRAPTLECLKELVNERITRGSLSRAINSSELAGYARESAILTVDELFRSMGWADQAAPTFLKW